MQDKRSKVLADKCASYERFLGAAYDGNMTTVLEMLMNGSVHVDSLGTRKWGRISALYQACKAGHMSTVQALI